jgi:hypothetical protein
MAKSIIQKDKTKCFLCKQNACGDPLDKHHVFFGAMRGKSERYGLTVYIHHNKCHIFGDNAVHKNAEVNRKLQSFAQKKAMKHYGWSVEDFRREFYKSYI